MPAARRAKAIRARAVSASGAPAHNIERHVRHNLISVALIEDNRMTREGLAALLSQAAGFHVVASVPVCDAALLRDAKPQVILLDVGLGNNGSLRAAETAKREVPESRVIITDLLPARDDIVDFVNAGVSGFILKDATFEDLVSTIQSVAGGAQVLPPAMTSSLFSQITKKIIVRGGPDVAQDDAVRMTPREREVVELIGEGLSNKELAQRLSIATHTVKSHVRNVMEKLALHTRLQIAAFAHRTPTP